MLKKHYKLYTIPVLMISMLFLCGAAFSVNKPKLNIDDRPVYANLDPSLIAEEVAKDYDNASAKYKDADIVSQGIISSIAENQKSLKVKFDSVELEVTTSNKNEVAALSQGDKVTVYGKPKIGSSANKTVSIKADHILKATDTMKAADTLKDDYYIYQGKSYSDKDSTEIALADDRIKFDIPKNWKYTEVDQTSYEKIFNSMIYKEGTGKCYYINNVKGNAEPEIFCAFYFDNNVFLDRSGDSSRIFDIEKAIVTNICPEEKTSFTNPSTWKILFPTSSSTTSKGVKLHHYVGNYDNYRVEFVFAPVTGDTRDDNGGICVMMYLYNDDSTKPDDVLQALNSLEIDQ